VIDQVYHIDLMYKSIVSTPIIFTKLIFALFEQNYASFSHKGLKSILGQTIWDLW